MKKKTFGWIFWGFYLLGCIISYPLSKEMQLKSYHQQRWTEEDRLVCLLFTPLSWIMVGADMLAITFEDPSIHDDAKW